MDKKGKYSTSALQLKQIPHVETTVGHLKPNLNSFASCLCPLGAADIWKLKSEDSKHAHSFQPSIEILNKLRSGSLVRESGSERNLTAWLCDQILNKMHFSI